MDISTYIVIISLPMKSLLEESTTTREHSHGLLEHWGRGDRVATAESGLPLLESTVERNLKLCSI